MSRPATPNGATANVGPARAMAFEMQTGGHHPSYIRNFALQWAERIPHASIDFVVTRQFLKQHAEVVQLVNSIAPDRIQIHVMSDEEDHRVRNESKLREFAGWKIFCDYARRLQADKAMLMYSDHFQVPMLLGQRAPCPVSCIYFRPTFHYHQFSDYQPTWKQQLAAIRKKLLLGRLLHQKQMDALFCLDPFAVQYIQHHLPTHVRIRRLPDAFVQPEIPQQRLNQLRRELHIGDGRKVLLLLGILDSRKGPMQLLEAVDALTDEVKRELCLLVIGKLDESIAGDVLQKIGLLQSQNRMQLVVRNQYISDTLVQDYYQIADVALTTYQQHMGMSSALIRAALAQIPVLSSSYGLMGEMVKRYQLGIVADTTDPNDFVRGLAQAITLPADQCFDRQSALAFAALHTPQALGETLAEWIGPTGLAPA